MASNDDSIVSFKFKKKWIRKILGIALLPIVLGLVEDYGRMEQRMERLESLEEMHYPKPDVGPIQEEKRDEKDSVIRMLMKLLLRLAS